MRLTYYSNLKDNFHLTTPTFHHPSRFTTPPVANMVYTMEIYVDGGCRGNGYTGSIGAAADVFKLKWGRLDPWTKSLPRYYPEPTNQRAEIMAIILALDVALEKYRELDTNPR